MAPTNNQGLAKRYCDYYGNCDYYYSTWDNWGRWVALVVVVVAFALLAFLFSCFNTRRRRRRGLAPMYGTGWMGGSKYNNQNNNGGYYGGAQPYHGAPAPEYTPNVENQATGTTFNNGEGYYGHHNNGYGGQNGGIELQQPQSAYQPQRGGDPVYEAPLGPPPGKGDGIIR